MARYAEPKCDMNVRSRSIIGLFLAQVGQLAVHDLGDLVKFRAWDASPLADMIVVIGQQVEVEAHEILDATVAVGGVGQVVGA
jgi:hypothetical protein